MEGFDNLTLHSQLGNAAWLESEGFPPEMVEAAAKLEEDGKVSWNGWRGDMGWLGEAAPGYTAGKPTPEGHAPPAAYTAEQSDTRRMCDIAINFINSQVSCSSSSSCSCSCWCSCWCSCSCHPGHLAQVSSLAGLRV